MEVLLAISGLDVERIEETKLVNMHVKIKEGDMGRGDGSDKTDRVAIVEVLMEKEIMAVSL